MRLLAQISKHQLREKNPKGRRESRKKVVLRSDVRDEGADEQGRQVNQERRSVKALAM